MLLRFTSPDILNASLIDVATGERAYTVTTESLPDFDSSDFSSTISTPFSGTDSVLLSPSGDFASSSASFAWRQPESSTQSNLSEGCHENRRTQIADAHGNTLVDVQWKGRRPDITLCGDRIGGLTELFGSSSVRFMPKVLAIPTRFDSEYVWQATTDSLSLFDYDTDSVKGSLHLNSIRIPRSSKPRLSTPSSPQLKHKSSKLRLFSSSKTNTPMNSANAEYGDCDVPFSTSQKSTFIPAHLPGLGSNYLEFESHPQALDVEIILSFLMMEILRRGRFSLTPYSFNRRVSPAWHSKEARESFLRRLRRNTV